MGAPYSGKDAVIYVSGTELVGGNAWEINSSMDTVEAPEFGDTWKKHVAGLLTWSGSITAWDQGDDKLLFTAATAGVSVALLIYPDANTAGNYYSGSALFAASSSASTSAPVAKSATFTGDGALTITGFA
jgi:hypothetical protein